jgi:hypothetical protein
MHKYAAATALAIALNITTLTPAVSAGVSMTLNEEACDGWAHGLRVWAIRCHCNLECRRQYSYTVTLPCSPVERGWHEGLCDRRVIPVEAAAACYRTCVKAKTGTYP